MNTIPQDKIQKASEGLRAIAHELRLAVLCQLLNGPMCVADLMAATGSSQSNLSQHLTKMRMMGILTNEKQGQRVFYKIADPSFADLVMTLKKIYCPDIC
ncbi:MAG: metalloregulator ArsR/SmtB family transcription factor [Gammaproteobacteria bacterium]|nr:metalloregulator ArsR/SmtB family transcription factor [Gammaproteobacteria bacterium]